MSFFRSLIALVFIAPMAVVGKLVGSIEAIAPATVTGQVSINHPEGKSSTQGYITVNMAGLVGLAKGSISVGSDKNCNDAGGLDLNGAFIWADAT